MRNFFLPCLVALSMAGCASTAALAPVQSHNAQVNGVTLPYIEQGQGETVVFVHGSMSDARMWEAQRPAIAAHYRYIAYTQRYFGSTPWQDEGKAFSQMTHAADLAAFIKQLNVGPVHVVAWSYGGSVATLTATQHPELFRSLSLHEPTIGSLIVGSEEGKVAAAAFGKSIGGLRATVNAGQTAQATHQFWEFVVRLPDHGFGTEAPALQQMVDANAAVTILSLNAAPQPITCAMLKSISAPVLITVGANTRALWSLAGSAMQQCLPNGKLVLIPNSNHDAPFRQPAAFNRALLDFLSPH